MQFENSAALLPVAVKSANEGNGLRLGCGLDGWCNNIGAMLLDTGLLSSIVGCWTGVFTSRITCGGITVVVGCKQIHNYKISIDIIRYVHVPEDRKMTFFLVSADPYRYYSPAMLSG